jgi:hypothetical protein
MHIGGKKKGRPNHARESYLKGQLFLGHRLGAYCSGGRRRGGGSALAAFAFAAEKAVTSLI